MKKITIDEMTNKGKINFIEKWEEYYCVECLENTVLHSESTAVITMCDDDILDSEMLNVNIVHCKWCKGTTFIDINDYERDLIRLGRIDEMIEMIEEITQEKIIDKDILDNVVKSLEEAKNETI